MVIKGEEGEDERRINKHIAMPNKCPHAHFLPIMSDPKRRDKGIIMDGCLMAVATAVAVPICSGNEFTRMMYRSGLGT